MKKTMLTIFLALSSLFAVSCLKATPESKLYVSSYGSNHNPGTIQQPLKTIQKAVDLSQPGTTVYIRKGTYKEQIVIKNSGQKKAPIVIRSYPKEKVKIDGTGVKISWDNQGLLSIHNKSYITIDGLEIRNYITKQEDSLPIGISVSGSGKGIQLLRNHIHHIETQHPDGNAHGIAVYGTKAPQAIEDVLISGNTLEDMKLGWSEALAVNGNVSDFRIQDNVVRRTNNIGIDVIGFEGTSPDDAFDQARNGVISRNTVYEVSSYRNPAYGKEYTAGGIYVDGGKQITIEDNQIYRNDIGIEAASEHKGKSTSSINIRRNTIYENRSAGISIGGYDEDRGNTEYTAITENTIYKNDTEFQESGQIYLQYNSRHNRIENNIIVAGSSRLLISNPFKQSEGNRIDHNLYYLEQGEKKTRWIWRGDELSGFDAYKKQSLQDRKSVFRKPKFVDEKKRELRIAE